MSLKEHYPQAIGIKELEQTITSELNNDGLSLSKTIWGTSICSDEVNNTFNALNKLFIGPGAFRFGGISGLPFTGQTGVIAFASHIPEDGHAFILYGPHVGVSEKGVIGEIHRQGQNNNSTCCGSLIAGLAAIENSPSVGTESSSDYQQYRVVKMLQSERSSILTADNKIKEVTEKAYSHIHEELKSLLNDCKEALVGTKIYLMGGMVINTDWDKEDYFEIRNQEVIEFT
jgi:hypothetical protein